MEYATEIINISKIKEGFYIGDRFAGTNLEVIMHFKITHIINAAATQIINTFETIGIKYLSLVWSDNQNQKLFTSNDENVDRIIEFIDDSFTNGEGLLVHSVKGQNRVCIVVIIYLMKKFKWGLMKCIDFLHSKKADVNITKLYLSQLTQFEMRLVKMEQGVCSYSRDWNDEAIEDAEEMLLRNTYVNGIHYKITRNNNFNKNNNKRGNKPKIGWGDFNQFNTKDTLIHPNPCKDLIMRKVIQPITAHLRLRPSKSCIKVKKSSEEIEKATDYYDNNIKCVKNKEDNSQNGNEKIDEMKMDNNIIGVFGNSINKDAKEKNQRDKVNNNNYYYNGNDKNNDLNQQFAKPILIQSNIKQKNSINNSNSDSFNEEKNNNTSYDDSKLPRGTKMELMPSSNREDHKENERLNNFKSNKYSIYTKNFDNTNSNLPKRPSTVDRNTNNPHKDIFNKKAINENNFIDGNTKGFIMKNSISNGLNLYNKKKVNHHYNIESIQKPLGNNSIERKNHNCKYNDYNLNNTPGEKMKANGKKSINNYVNSNNNNDWVLKKNNSNDAILPKQNQMSKNYILNNNLSANDINILHNYQSRIVPLKVNSNNSQNYILAYNKPLNNFDPSLMKKSQNMFLRATHSLEKGPIKLSKECMISKPLTPDQMLYLNGMRTYKKSKGLNKNNYNEIYGTLDKKPSSNNNHSDINCFRPSTAPQKDKQKQKKQKKKKSNDDLGFSNPMYSNPIYPPMKRLPSPMIQSSQLMHSKKIGISTSTGFAKSSHLILRPSVLSTDPYKSLALIK